MLASLATIVTPTPAAAQSGAAIEIGEAALSPAVVSAGERVTVHPAAQNGCFAGSGHDPGLLWAVFPKGEFVWGEHLGWEPADALVSGVGTFQGQLPFVWSASFVAPDLRDGLPDVDEIGPGSPVIGDTLNVFGPLSFTVDGHELEWVAKCYPVPDDLAELVVSPEVPVLGEVFRVTPQAPCPMPHTQGGTAHVELWQATPEGGGDGPFGTHIIEQEPVAVGQDGSWSVEVVLPDRRDSRYGIAAHCVNVEGGSTTGYLLTPFEVREPGGPPIDPPSVPWPTPAPPAQPVPGDPRFTG